jgi:methyl-accepting chemotaxis protein
VAHGNFFGRIASLRFAMERAHSGDFGHHASAIRNDSLGMVEQSLRELLGRIECLVEAIRREIEEVVGLGGVFANSTTAAVQTSQKVASVAAALSSELHDLRSAAEAGEAKCRDSVHDAQGLQARAEGSAGDVRELEDHAEIGRERISRAIETLLAVGKDIERTGRIVAELSGLSRQIGSSAISIAKVARHTHILALNAAIEAARAQEHGDEFSVVADQVRTLAGEAGRSAREVGDLVSEVNAGIAAAANSLAAGEEKVKEVSQIASEGRSAIARIRSGFSSAADFVTETTVSFQSQAKSAISSADALSRMADAITRWSTEVQVTSSEVEGQLSLLGELDRTCKQLSETGDRLRMVVAGFSAREH